MNPPHHRLLLGPLLVCAVAAGAATWKEARPLRWEFTAEREAAGFAATPDTPPARGSAAVGFAPAESGGGLVLNRAEDVLVVASPLGELLEELPREALTVSAWVAVETPRRWGGVVGCVQDNADFEKGWVLGYDESRFTFGLATEGADDGNGLMTYMAADRPYTAGAWHHLCATYDGRRTRLYVDGELAGEDLTQSGPVLYDPSSAFVIGAYLDENERYVHDGRLLEVEVRAGAAEPGEVRDDWQARRDLAELTPWTDRTFGFEVEPYLTWPTQEAISLLFETTFPSTAEVHLRAAEQPPEAARVLQSAEARLHELRIEGLEADQKYFYEVRVTAIDGKQQSAPLRAFRTAASPDRPFTFLAIGDTQSQPEVVRRVSDLGFEHRPNLVVLAGDLVGTGSSKTDWTEHFFPNMQPLLAYAPLMPVLGNHEQDAEHYYRYMSLPEPERWYAFSYGNAEFFMIDGNRSLADQSAQLRWLEGALAASSATWKFAVLHQPPYTSDADDYGDTQVTVSNQGDLNARNIVALLEEHGVDICFSGHVHDYERTFPIKDGRVTSYEAGGVVYVTTAGGGGHLEDFDPVNTWFGHKKARRHHLVYVAVNGDELEYQAVDEDGRLFDVMRLDKRGR